MSIIKNISRLKSSLPKVNKVAKTKRGRPAYSHPLLDTGKLFKKKVEKPEKGVYKKPLSLDEMLRDLRELINFYTQQGGLKVSNMFNYYMEQKRKLRVQTDLKAYYLQSFSKGVFRFVVKSSGKSPQYEAYYVDFQWKDLEFMALSGVDTKEILLKSNIKVNCACKDCKYRHSYYLTKMGAKLGLQQYVFPKITNPTKKEGFVCKHIGLVNLAVQKPSFYNIFNRYVENTKKGKAGVRVGKKEQVSTYLASGKMKRKIED
jgi:hypothetical protein